MLGAHDLGLQFYTIQLGSLSHAITTFTHNHNHTQTIAGYGKYMVLLIQWIC